jgi:predicted ATP-grasp superfamily ATP-dependent carboligase
MRALVLSSSNVRGAVAAVRRLREAGWTVSAGAADPEGPLAWTRATESIHPVLPAERDLGAFLGMVDDAVRATGAEVVFPSGDADLLALSHGRAQIGAVVPLADDGVVRRLVDKLDLVRAAEGVGLDAPATMPADEAGFASASYPVVVKARFHWLPGYAAGAPARLDATVCATEAAARQRVLEMQQAGAKVVLQELISGPQIYVHAISDRQGMVLSAVQQEGSGRLYPPGIGIRVRSVVVPLDPKLDGGIRRLLAESGWFGFACFTFILGPDGRHRVIDFNGRIGGSLEATAGAGPNHLAVWAALATGRTPPPLPEPRIGQRFQWLEGDLRRAMRERRGGLIRDTAGAFAYAFGATHTILKRDDPLLAVRYAARQLRLSRFVARERPRSRNGTA